MMAKKKITPNDPSAPPAAPVKRRAPARKKKDAESHGNGKTQPSQAEIAEAAYFRSLNRGGGQGDQFNDWVEAERELRARRSR